MFLSRKSLQLASIAGRSKSKAIMMPRQNREQPGRTRQLP